ncbi:MAG: alpha/beta fold hydrolase [Acidimicrobiales bacterium]
MSELGIPAGAPPALWAQEVGEGPLVVLVHGAMDRSGGMLRVRRALQDECRVLRYDRRGYGRSLAAGPAVSFEQQVDDLAGLVAGRRAVLAGHSLGGVICLALAEREPGLVRSVLAYEAPMMWEPWWPRDSPGLQVLELRAEGHTDGRGEGGGDEGGDDGDDNGRGNALGGDAAEWFLRRMIGDARWDRLPELVRAERRAEGAALVAELRSVHPPAPSPYTPERVPVAVLSACGSETSSHHRRAAHVLARRVPQAQLQLVDGAGHGAHLSHPEAFADLVRHTLGLGVDAERIPDRPAQWER